MNMISIVERLRFDATRCELQFSKGVAANIDEGADEIERLRRVLTEMVEAFEPFTSRPMGAPNSDARIKQQLQIAAYRNARSVLTSG
jgi:hypothetical protein